MSVPGAKAFVSLALLLGGLFILALLPHASFHLADRARDKLQDAQALSEFNAAQLERLQSSHAEKSAASQKALRDSALTPSKGLGLAGAELQSLLSSLIRNGAGQPGSLQVLPPKTEGEFAKVTVQAVFKASNKAFRRIILDIEQHVPFVFVEHLSVQNLSEPRSNGSVASERLRSGNGRETLEISVTASNYMKIGKVAEKRIE